jgi:hypothetical protein
VGYDACVESCGSEDWADDPDVDAGTPADASRAGLERR